jgi:hypothetical protein
MFGGIVPWAAAGACAGAWANVAVETTSARIITGVTTVRIAVVPFSFERIQGPARIVHAEVPLSSKFTIKICIMPCG